VPVLFGGVFALAIDLCSLSGTISCDSRLFNVQVPDRELSRLLTPNGPDRELKGVMAMPSSRSETFGQLRPTKLPIGNALKRPPRARDTPRLPARPRRHGGWRAP